MTAAEIAAWGVAITAVLGALGAALKYIIGLILDAYKRQADSTVAAKDQEAEWLRGEVEDRFDRLESKLDRIVEALDP